jgi:hypothetical protein
MVKACRSQGFHDVGYQLAVRMHGAPVWCLYPVDAEASRKARTAAQSAGAVPCGKPRRRDSFSQFRTVPSGSGLGVRRPSALNRPQGRLLASQQIQRPAGQHQVLIMAFMMRKAMTAAMIRAESPLCPKS